MKKLDRELGLFSVFSVSCGAMIGSGIFVLPGLAVSIGGPSAFIAYAFAGLVVLPAALSKAEMATAMPESGGTYLYLDRSLGPLAGTLTGIGTWISLILKSGFALIGLSAYLVLFTHFSVETAKYIGAGIGVALVIINLLGVKKSGVFQSILVFLTLSALWLFVGRGSIEVVRDHYHPFFQKGALGFFSSAAFIFVSYAGVTKIASMAEEIKDPGRTIPWGILLSLVTMILVYTAVAFVIVGVVPFDLLGKGSHKLTPMAIAGEKIAGQWGLWILSIVAILALTSMANAGILSSSRFPLAMARDRHLPRFFTRVHSSFSTPHTAILVTGGLLIGFILLLPVKELAKLASCFKLLVFSFINLALIVFRESEIEWYQPEFTSPLYPHLQVGGFLGALGLVVLMSIHDIYPLIGAMVLILLSVSWYFLYAKDRMERTGALWHGAANEEELEAFEKARTRSTTRKESVIVPFFGLKEVNLHIERRIRLAASLCASDERLDVVHFVEVPDQSFLGTHEPDETIEKALQQRVHILRNEIQNEIHFDEVVTHNSRGALRNYAEEEKPHWIVFDWKKPSPWQFLLGRSQKWWLTDFPTDILFLKDRQEATYENILVITRPGPFDGEVVYAADHIAGYYDGNITFLNAASTEDQDQNFMQSYQRELKSICSSSSESILIEKEGWFDNVIEWTRDADMLVIGGLTEQDFQQFLNEEVSDRLVEEAHCSVSRIQSSLRSPRSVFSKEMREQRETEPSSTLMEYLHQERILTNVSVDNKNELFSLIARQLSDDQRTPEEIENNLWEREQVQSTYVGNGIAYPHAILDSLHRTIMMIVHFAHPVEYTEDEELVNLCVVIIGPPSERQVHLELVGEITDLFTRENVKEFIQNNPDSTEVYQKLISCLEDQENKNEN